MRFKILGSKKDRANYVYLVQGERDWGIADLAIPFIGSSSNTNYAFCYSFDSKTSFPFSFIDKRDKNKKAILGMRKTLDLKVKEVHIFDEGNIGEKVIEYFMRAIEK